MHIKPCLEITTYQSCIILSLIYSGKVTKEVEEQEPHPNLNVMSFDMGDIGGKWDIMTLIGKLGHLHSLP